MNLFGGRVFTEVISQNEVVRVDPKSKRLLSL